LTVGAGPATQLARLIGENPLQIDPESHAIVNASEHAGTIAAEALLGLAGNKKMLSMVQDVLPKLGEAVEELPAGGVASVFPARPGKVPAAAEVTAADNVPVHSGRVRDALDRRVAQAIDEADAANRPQAGKGRNGAGDKAPDGPLAAEVKGAVAKAIPDKRDPQGRWKNALRVSVRNELCKKDTVRLTIEDRGVALSRTLSAIAECARNGGKHNRLMTETAERLVFGLVLKSEAANVGLDSESSASLKLVRDLMSYDVNDPERIRQTLPLNAYFTDEQIDNLAVVRRRLEVAAATRYPLSRLNGDLYGLILFFRELEKTGEEGWIFLGDAEQVLAWMENDNLGPATEGGLLRNGKLLSGEAVPVTGLFLGNTAFTTMTPAQFIRRYRELRLARNGQSFVQLPAVLALGAADAEMAWRDEGVALSGEALGPGGGQRGDEVPVLIAGPSPMLANDPQVTIPASLLAAARVIGGDVSDVLNPGAADVSAGRFVSLSGAVDLNLALDNLIYGPLYPEKEGPNDRRCFAADHYAHVALLAGAMLEKANLTPAPRWGAVAACNFAFGPKTTDKTSYREALPSLDDAVLGGRASRYSLHQEPGGDWVVRIAIPEGHALDEDDGSGTRVAAYPVPQLESIRRRAELSAGAPADAAAE
jgi:hypothetical protein